MMQTAVDVQAKSAAMYCTPVARCPPQALPLSSGRENQKICMQKGSSWCAALTDKTPSAEHEAQLWVLILVLMA